MNEVTEKPKNYEVYCDDSFIPETFQGSSAALVISGETVFAKHRTAIDCTSSAVTEFFAAYMGIRELPEMSTVFLYSDNSFVLSFKELYMDKTRFNDWLNRENADSDIRRIARAMIPELQKRKVYFFYGNAKKNPAIKWCDKVCSELHKNNSETWETIKTGSPAGHLRSVLNPPADEQLLRALLQKKKSPGWFSRVISFLKPYLTCEIQWKTRSCPNGVSLKISIGNSR